MRYYVAASFRLTGASTRMAEQVRNPPNQNADTRSQRTDSRADRGTDRQRNQWRAGYLLQDVRFALRTLRKSWGFAVTAVLTLALGIGANAAIFQLLDAVRLRSLPVANPATLAAVRVKSGTHGFGITSGGDYDTMLSYPMWEQIRLHQQSFSGVFDWAQSGWVSLGEGAQERHAQLLWVSGQMFSVLGVPPLRGRMFTEKDDQPNCGLPGVAINYALWQGEFGGQDSAIGSRLIIEGHPTEVIGVTPRSFFGMEVGRGFDIAVPFCSLTTYAPAALTTTRSDFFWLHVVGRLKQGLTLEQASSQLSAMSPGFIEVTLPTGYSSTSLNIYKNFRLAAYPGGNGISWLRQTYDTSLWLLLGTTGLVLLIACANLANLMLVRASTRAREMAVRLALGASRWRLIRQLLSEGFVLAGAGTVLGIALAEIFSRSLVHFLSTGNNPVQLGISLEWRVLLFTGALMISTCASVFACGTWAGIEEWKPRDDGRPRTLLLSAPAGGFPNCSFSGAACRRAAVCKELLELGDARPRFSRKRNFGYLRGLKTPGLAARAIRALHPRFAGGGENRAAGGVVRHFDAHSFEPQQHLEPWGACEWR